MYRFAGKATLYHGQTFAIFFLFITDSSISHAQTILKISLKILSREL